MAEEKKKTKKEAKKKESKKPEKKPAEKEAKTVGKEQKKEKEIIPKVIIEKPAVLKKIQEKIKKKKHPVFRGRFGKRKLRNKSKEKWNRWRKPRGIDIIRRKEDGALPKTGYRTELLIRNRHPSGYFARMVNNVKELENISQLKETAAVISGNVGKRKRKEILKKAGELKIVVLNR